MTMASIILRCQRRCDREGDDTIGAAEWQGLISEAYGELYSIVAETGLRYFETTSTITTTGAASYTEPSDHLGTVLVYQLVNTAGERRDLIELMSQEESRWAGIVGEACCYTFVDDQVTLYPTPPAGQTYKLAYVSQPPDLSTYATTDVVDVVNAFGESFLINGTLVKALPKLDEDVSVAMRERDRAGVQLEEWAILRALAQPRRRVVLDAEVDGGYDGADWRNRP